MAKKKTWKDVTSISAAKKEGLAYFKGKDDQKKLAVTKETLDAWKKRNKGKYKGSSLTAWANAKGKDLKSDLKPLKRPEVIKEEVYRYDYEPGQITETDLGKADKNYKQAKPNVRTGPKTGEKAKKVPPKPKLRIYRDTIENQRERREWEKKYGKDYNNDGTLKKNPESTPKPYGKRGANIGGLMPTTQRKINPTTGLSMNRGGMTDMRKTGMFYGGMARKK